MPLSPAEMGASIERNLPVKTGRTMDAWKAAVRARTAGGPVPRRETVAWLKREHGLGHVTAELIVSRVIDEDAGYVPPSADELVAAQYAGPKAGLRPVYERLVAAARDLGEDVTLAPRQTYVALARGRQFALVQPSTRDRVDLGLKLPDTPAGGRLRPAGSFGSGAVTHRVALSAPPDVDGEVLDWLRAAYARLGP